MCNNDWFEDISFNDSIWILKYDMYQKLDSSGEFYEWCDKDDAGAVKMTSCHGWYDSEESARKAIHEFKRRGSSYYIERVYKRILREPS